MIRKFFGTVALGSLFVGGLAASHLAFAQPGADGPGHRGGRGGMMAMADTNKDGAISKAEMTAALEGRFAKMDVDKDGKLTQADRDAMRAQRLDKRFAMLDTDKNGQVSKAEFAAAHEARADKRAERGEGRKWQGRGHHRGHGMMGMRADANKDLVTVVELFFDLCKYERKFCIDKFSESISAAVGLRGKTLV